MGEAGKEHQALLLHCVVEVAGMLNLPGNCAANISAEHEALILRAALVGSTMYNIMYKP